GSLALTPLIGAEFIPGADEGQIQIRVETAPGSSLKHTERISDQVNDKLSNYEDLVETNFVSIGGGGFDSFGASGNQATYTMQLIPSADRDETTTEVVKNIHEDLQEIPSAEITVSSM